MSKHIFITGGVVSGLGKGITGSSLANILKASGFSVFMQKFDPYLNIDPGTLSPYQHGEVFVTYDGAETDLDLGHYERFTDTNLSQESNITSGKIYQTIIDRERNGYYEGATVQVVPHVTNLIKEKICIAEKNNSVDIVITEIGGTVGDIESAPFIEAIRQVRNEQGRNDVLFIHVGLIPFIASTQESKTKPIQHSVKELLSFGLQPDIIVARTENKLDKTVIDKIALFCNIPSKNVLIAEDAKSIYDVPLMLHAQNASSVVLNCLQLENRIPDMTNWEKFVKKIKNSQRVIDITIVGKYVELPDAYLSVIESLNIAGYEKNVKIDINWVKSDEITSENYKEFFQDSKGIIIPGGFGERGIEGKILAARYARENNIPFLGLCLGMQVATIEFARNKCKIKNAHSSEFSKTNNPIIDLISGKSKGDALGGTLRLGLYKTDLKKGTLAYNLYQQEVIYERHRHRYEFNNKYRDLLESFGMVFSGIYKEKNLVEIIEIPENDFFIASQYHPEFTSRPNKPNPLFEGLIKAVLKKEKNGR